MAESRDKGMLLAFPCPAARRREIFRLTWSDIDFGCRGVRFWTRKQADGSNAFDRLPTAEELRQQLLWWCRNGLGRSLKTCPGKSPAKWFRSGADRTEWALPDRRE